MLIFPLFLCIPGSCPNLIMSRNEHHDPRPHPVALTPQLPPRAHRPLCLSVSSDSNGRFKALETQEWKNNLKAQVALTHAQSVSVAKQTHSMFYIKMFLLFTKILVGGFDFF